MVFSKIVDAAVIYPPTFSPALCNLLDGLLAKDPTQRLAYAPGGIANVAAHPWFAAADWKALDLQAVSPPAELRAAMYDLEPLPVLPLNAAPLPRQPAWLANF